MSKIGFRECHFIKVDSIDVLIEELTGATKELKIPKEYDLKIYKSVYGCCGVSDSNLIVEIIGPDEEKIKDIDLEVMSKLIDICQKKGHEYHILDHMKIA